MDSLITDRTANDVQYVKTLGNKINSNGISSLTSAEKTAWESGMKGSYNEKDFNRLKEWIEHLAELFNEYEFYVSITPMQTISRTDFPLHSNIQVYLSNIQILKNAYYTMSTTPQLPTNMQNLGYSGANAIEKILYDLNELFEGMIAHFYYLGEIYLGE